MNNLLSTYNLNPKYKTYVIEDEELEGIFRDMLEKETGIEQKGLFVDADPETFCLYVIFNDDWVESLSDEEWDQFMERLPEGMHVEEWATSANIMLRKLFGEYERAYADVNDYGDSFYATIEVPYA